MCDLFSAIEVRFVETVTEVPENTESFIQMVTVFREEEFLLMFFMDLRTVDSSASELVGREGEVGKLECGGRMKEEGRHRCRTLGGQGGPLFQPPGRCG